MWAAVAATVLLLAACLFQVIRTAADLTNTNVDSFVAPALSAVAVFVVVFGVTAFIRKFDISIGRGFAWIIGLVSLALSAVPMALITLGQPTMATVMYEGLRIPQGLERFWDLTLVLRSVDCDAWGFNVFVDNNGCMADAAIYGPGMLWLKYLPFGIFSAGSVKWLGLLAMIVSSLALVWLARNSDALGKLTLLVAAAGAPWLLLIERGNVDAAVLWCALLVVIIVRRWNNVWVWSIAAAAIWLMGTWKYYPFAMGLMLIPVLRLQRGWIVLLGWIIASVGFVLLTWSNFMFSADSNSTMTTIGDAVVLGRVPVVVRMDGSQLDATWVQTGDVLVLLLAVAAGAWGVLFARQLRRGLVHESMLAIAGSSVFLVSVLVAGFGWAYKAAFLLLTVPLLASVRGAGRRAMVFSSISMLLLVGLCSVVVWNTLLATLAGVIAASFAFGASATLLVRRLRPTQVEIESAVH